MDDPTKTGTLNVGMPSPRTAGSVRASITVGGDLSGQIAVGSNIVQMRIGELHGNVVLPAEQPPQVERRTPPLRLLPRRPAAFVDRDAETSSTSAALAGGLSVCVTGGPGVGKSSLLRHLAHQPLVATAGGVAHVSVRGQPRDDILQYLFDLCYDTDRPYKPTRGQLRHYLQSIDCTLLVDDLDLTPEDVADLLDFSPASRFVFSSARRVDLDGVRSVQLAGLPAKYALDVLATALGRPLLAHERVAATALSAAVDGVPGHLVQSAAAIRDGRMLLEAAASTPAELWTAVAARDEPDRRLLAALAALPTLRLGEEDLRIVSGVADTDRRLTDLCASGLVQVFPASAGAEDGYEAVEGVAECLPEPAVAAVRRLLRDHLMAWAGTRPSGEASALRVLAALTLLRASSAAHEWGDTLALCRAVDPILALSGRWEAWRQTLSMQLTAARALSDQAAESYALHQLGTRALCLGQSAEARVLLVEALRNRDLRGDRAGASVTRHNLALLPAPPPPGSDHPPDSRQGWAHRTWHSLTAAPIPVKASLAVVLLLLVAVPASTAILGSLSGPAGAIRFALTPARLSFPAQQVNTASSPQAATVRNQGISPLHLGAVDVSGPNGADFVLAPGGCVGATLPAGGSCRVVVTFIPTLSGDRHAALTLTPAGSADSGVIPLTGTGNSPRGAAAAITVTPSQLSFPTQPVGTASGPQPARIAHSAGGQVRLGNIRVTGTNPGDFQLDAGTCRQAKLATGRHCELQVVFRPSAAGTRTAVVTVAVPGPRPDLVLPVSGIGRPTNTGDVTNPGGDPTVTVPTSAVEEATGPDGAPVTYQVSAADATGQALTASCTPASGSTFAIGTQTVECTAADDAGRHARANFPVTVRDSQPPQLQLPKDPTIEATSADGADVTYDPAVAADVVSGPLEVTCSRSSGSVFPLGDTAVNCSATDAAGNIAERSFTVHVVDRTPPVLTLPNDPVSPDYKGLVTATDLVDDNVTLDCTPPSGSPLLLNGTRVTCTATDDSGNQQSGGFTVTVTVIG
jgi:hypothetical protein